MTIGAVSNLGLGLGSTNYMQYYNDPYFLQALQSPNYYQLQAQNIQQPGTQVPTPTATANPSFKGASEQIADKGEKTEKKSNKAAKWVLGTLATAGTIFAGYKCFKKGGGKEFKDVFSTIWKGFKQYWDDGIDAISKWQFNKPSSSQPLAPREVNPTFDADLVSTALATGSTDDVVRNAWINASHGADSSLVEQGSHCVSNLAETADDALRNAWINAAHSV